MIAVKQLRAHNPCQIGKGSHMHKGSSYFSSPTKAVPLHTSQPARITSPCIDHTCNFFAEAASSWRIRIGVVNMI